LAEVADQKHTTRFDQVVHGGDDFFLAGCGIGNGCHEIEQSERLGVSRLETFQLRQCVCDLCHLPAPWFPMWNRDLREQFLRNTK
jgi:hypothetical protein